MICPLQKEYVPGCDLRMMRIFLWAFEIYQISFQLCPLYELSFREENRYYSELVSLIRVLLVHHPRIMFLFWMHFVCLPVAILLGAFIWRVQTSLFFLNYIYIMWEFLTPLKILIIAEFDFRWSETTCISRLNCLLNDWYISWVTMAGFSSFTHWALHGRALF